MSCYSFRVHFSFGSVGRWWSISLERYVGVLSLLLSLVCLFSPRSSPTGHWGTFMVWFFFHPPSLWFLGVTIWFTSSFSVQGAIIRIGNIPRVHVYLPSNRYSLGIPWTIARCKILPKLEFYYWFWLTILHSDAKCIFLCACN